MGHSLPVDRAREAPRPRLTHGVRAEADQRGRARHPEGHRFARASQNPERFHIEKSEIANDLNRVIAALRIGHNIPNLEPDER